MKASIRVPCLAALFLMATASVRAEEPATNPDYWQNYPRGLAGIVTAPARWDDDQWRTAALVAAATGGLFLVDEPLRDWWQDHVRGGATNTLADVSRPFGSNATVAAGSLVLVGAGLLTDNRTTGETGLLTLQGLVLSNFTLESIKLLTHRRRPEDSPNDAHHWAGPGLHGGDKSFASGHSAKAFMLASIVASQYPDNRRLKVFSYGLAGLTALGRVNDDRHWASDVVAGAAIGYGIGHLVAGMSPFRDNDRVTLSPVTPDGSTGMSLSYRF